MCVPQLWTVSCIHLFSCGRYPVFISSKVTPSSMRVRVATHSGCVNLVNVCRTSQKLDIASPRLYSEFQNALQSDDSVLCFTRKKGGCHDKRLS